MAGLAGKLSEPLSAKLAMAGMGVLGAGSVALLDGSESDGTNLITGASDLDFTTWAALASTKTINNATSPAGTLTACRILEDVTTDRHGIYNSSIFTITGGSSHTYSVYAKSITRRYMQIILAVGGSAKIYAYFDLQSGAVTNSGTVSPSGGTAVTSTSIAAAVNGFYKCTITGIVDGTSTGPFFQFMASDVGTYGAPLTADSPSFAGNTSNGIYVWRPKAV